MNIPKIINIRKEIMRKEKRKKNNHLKMEYIKAFL